jgi:PAS domain S-box-containing protein
MDTSSANEVNLACESHVLTVLESSNDGFVSLDLCWSCCYMNHAAENLLRKRRADLLGKNIWEIFPELVDTAFWQQCQEAANTQSSRDVEDLTLPGGTSSSLRILPSPAGIALSFREKLPRVPGTEERPFSYQRTPHLVNLMELASDAIIVRDPTSKILSWNRGAERLYGWTAQEAIGKFTHEFLQTQFPTSLEQLDHFLATGEQWEGELTHTRKDGTQVIVESRQVVTRNTRQEPVAILEINRDMTERKQHEQENQEQYRTIVRTANEGIWLVDKQAHTLFMNARMAQMLGYTVEDLSGHAISEFVFPQDISRAYKHHENNLQGQFEQFDFCFQRKDGQPLRVLACTSPVRDGRGEVTGALGMFTDVTEREQGEATRLQLAALVESADIPMLSKTREGIITSWNKAAERMYGYCVQEMVGQPITLLFPLDRQEEFRRIMEQISLGKRVDLYETVRRRKDGTFLPVAVTISPIYDESGQIVGASDIAHDITERKRVEAQERFLTEVSKVLSSSLDYQETLANIARLVVPQLADWFAVDLVDAAGNFALIEIAHKDPKQVNWARRLREQFPIDPDALTGTPRVVRTGKAELYTDISDEMLVASARTEEELALARQIGYSSVMIVPLIARGKTVGVVSFIATESGKKYNERDLALAEEVGRQAGVALDHARLYREAQQSREQLEIILQGVADGIIVYAPDSRVIYANEAAARMTGYASIQEMLATPPLGITDEYELTDEQGHAFSHDQLTHRRVLAGEREAQAIIGSTRAGTAQPERWSLVTSRPVLDETGKITMIVTITHDITERIIVERRKDEFMSMTSHELKTPVTSLKGFTYVLQRRLNKQGDAQGLHYLVRMDAQLDKLTTLISDLLDISRMQSGKLALRMEACDLDALLEETVENMQAATLTHHLLIEGSTGAQVLGDKERLGQVFINLLTNAIKYSPRVDKVIVRLKREGEQEQAIVSVQDFGIGIAQNYHKHIFERFYQVTDPEEKTYPGLGIGLYISAEIVAQHHGRMWVESSKGAGSTFFVALPLLTVDAEAEMQRKERENKLNAEGS